MKLSKMLLALTALGLAFVVASPAQAQDHPAYMHALSDLRLMRAFLDRGTMSGELNQDQGVAIAEIDAAMREIRSASIDDHKNLQNHVPIDANITPSNRFRQAREAGNAAWHDLDREDDGFGNGLRRRAMDHIEKANHIVDQILHRFEHQ